MPQIIESAPSSIALNDNFSASYSDLADCIGSAKLINVLGAVALKAIEISGLSGLCLIFKVSIPDSSAVAASSSLKGNNLVIKCCHG